MTDAHPTFADMAHDLVRYHPPKNSSMADHLAGIRFAFDDLIDRLSLVIPNGPDAVIAAHKIHDACQAAIFARIHNQDGVVGDNHDQQLEHLRNAWGTRGVALKLLAPLTDDQARELLDVLRDDLGQREAGDAVDWEAQVLADANIVDHINRGLASDERRPRPRA